MNTREILYNFFSEKFPCNQEGLNEFINSFEEEHYKRNDILLSPDHKDNKLRFLCQGKVREYYATSQKEVNVDFYTKPIFISDFLSFEQDEFTKKWQQALSPVTILTLSKEKFLHLMEKYDCGKTFVDQVFRRLIARKEFIEYNRLTKTPDELYLCIVENNKEWFENISQYHIALFMGITPETLSRIRKRNL